MIGIIGFNEYTLAAVDACEQAGHDVLLVVPYSEDSTPTYVEPPLSQLEFSYPRIMARNINFQIIGGTHTDWEHRYHDLATLGMLPQQGIAPMAPVAEIFWELSRRYLDAARLPMGGWDTSVPLAEAIPEDVMTAVDEMINTHDRNLFCTEDHHTFMQREVWFSHTKGPSVPVDHVYFNASKDVSWAISANLGGRTTTVWQEEPPYDEIDSFTLPVRMACDCPTEWGPGKDYFHVGSWATYKPTTLVEVFDRTAQHLIENVPVPFEAPGKHEGKT